MTRPAPEHCERRLRRRRSRLRTMLSLSPWVLGSVLATVAGLWVFRDIVPPALLAPTNDFMGNVLQTLSAVYAVLLAFVVFVVWGQFNDARAAVEVEANAIGDLYRVLGGLAEPTRGLARADLIAYLDEVLEEEWPAMARSDEATMAALSAELDLVWRRLVATDMASESSQAFHAEALSRFNDVSDARSVRLACAGMRIPFALRALLYLGAFMTVALVFAQGIAEFALHAFAAGSVAGMIAHVLYVIEDLDDSFNGDWQVPRDPLVRLRAHLDGA